MDPKIIIHPKPTVSLNPGQPLGSVVHIATIHVFILQNHVVVVDDVTGEVQVQPR